MSQEIDYKTVSTYQDDEGFLSDDDEETKEMIRSTERGGGGYLGRIRKLSKNLLKLLTIPLFLANPLLGNPVLPLITDSVSSLPRKEFLIRRLGIVFSGSIRKGGWWRRSRDVALLHLYNDPVPPEDYPFSDCLREPLEFSEVGTFGNNGIRFRKYLEFTDYEELSEEVYSSKNTGFLLIFGYNVVV
ncbi:MAG: hypothetical protein PHH70_05140 [Candidatus Gracilibacteria bacterium]|nr:hypothetical protein [Candidatus Gracilibacteria bacterium]